MGENNINKKLIFGLKVKQHRLSNNLSFSDLAKKTGLSISYLNEIEKGKKYPKEDKISSLANALNLSMSEIKSEKLSGVLAPLGDLLKSKFLNELPLKLFGIELYKVVDIIANSPKKVGAFISTLVELSNTQSMIGGNFYFRALRAYQEMHLNYFEDLEEEIGRFVKEFDIPIGKEVPAELLQQVLEDKLGYKIKKDGLADYKGLSEFRAVFRQDERELLLNPGLNKMQLAFQLAKEIGFDFLGLKQRPISSSLIKGNSFEEVLNNFKASYFAVGILVNKESLLDDLHNWFQQKKLNRQFLFELATKYQASSSVLFQRFNVLPRYFGIDKLFYVRVNHRLDQNHFSISKELQLGHKNRLHASDLDEHYCRRSLVVRSLKALQEKNLPEVYMIQRSQYFGSDNEYMVIAHSRKNYPLKNINNSVSVGMLLDENARKTIKFYSDPSIPIKETNITCERCPIDDCLERESPPIVLEQRKKVVKLDDALSKILNA